MTNTAFDVKLLFPISKHDSLVDDLCVKYTQLLISTIKLRLDQLSVISVNSFGKVLDNPEPESESDTSDIAISALINEVNSVSEQIPDQTLYMEELLSHVKKSQPEYKIKLDELIISLYLLYSDLNNYLNTFINPAKEYTVSYELLNNVQTNCNIVKYLKYLTIHHSTVIKKLTKEIINDTEWQVVMITHTCDYTKSQYMPILTEPNISYNELDECIKQLYAKYTYILIYTLRPIQDELYDKMLSIELSIKISDFVFTLNNIANNLKCYNNIYSDPLHKDYYIDKHKNIISKIKICSYFKYLIKYFDIFLTKASTQEILDNDTQWNQYIQQHDTKYCTYSPPQDSFAVSLMYNKRTALQTIEERTQNTITRIRNNARRIRDTLPSDSTASSSNYQTSSILGGPIPQTPLAPFRPLHRSQPAPVPPPPRSQPAPETPPPPRSQAAPVPPPRSQPAPETPPPPRSQAAPVPPPRSQTAPETQPPPRSQAAPETQPPPRSQVAYSVSPASSSILQRVGSFVQRPQTNQRAGLFTESTHLPCESQHNLIFANLVNFKLQSQNYVFNTPT